MKCVQLLNTLCNQFYICSVLLEYTLVYHCGKYNFPVTIILWSSTLPPLWVPCVPRITTAMQKKILKTPLHNEHGWVKHVRHQGMIVILLFITCQQLILSSFQNFFISAFKKDISHEYLTLKT